MSSTAKTREFLVIIPDKPGVKDKRLEVRPTHLKNMTPLVESGDYKMGGAYPSNILSGQRTGRRRRDATQPLTECAVGALLNSVPVGGDPASFDFMGSTIVCKAETKEQVLEQLKNDVYVTSGVWDLEKLVSYPWLEKLQGLKPSALHE
ncbi:hypothetical protein E4U42_006432 [Claviceps africana]|uniref:YCII-related domain-containing protein n=1 Tax=Claviceps africana TaxID=83212 RepID=A0A8K0J2M3_9HYPO|nr:hypothetical protein E4U42_006432 [Claviceps africana]